MKTMMILKPPFLCRTIVMCLIACFVTSSYYTLTLWLPELFHRYADFQEAYPNQTASVCTLKSAKNVTEIVSDRITYNKYDFQVKFRGIFQHFLNISFIIFLSLDERKKRRKLYIYIRQKGGHHCNRNFFQQRVGSRNEMSYKVNLQFVIVIVLRLETRKRDIGTIAKKALQNRQMKSNNFHTKFSR